MSDIEEPPTKRSRVGKISSISLPVEIEFVRFIRDIQNPYASWDGETQISEWSGIRRSHETHYHIHWSNRNLRGSLYWECIPPNIVSLDLTANQLRGNVTLAFVPSCCHRIKLGHNSFGPGLDMSVLPQSLQILDLSENRFRTPLELRNLPRQLTHLILHHNSFTGTLRMSDVPASLSLLDVQYNKITLLESAETPCTVRYNDNPFRNSLGKGQPILDDLFHETASKGQPSVKDLFHKQKASPE